METPRDRDDRMAADLRALRPKPRPEFTTELDERAAAGFPRRSRLPRLSFDGLRAVPPRRLLIPAGSFAIVAIVVVTGVVVSQEGGDPARTTAQGQFSKEAPRNFDGGGKYVPGAAEKNKMWGGVQFEAEVPAAPSADTASSAAAGGELLSDEELIPTDSPTRLGHRAVERSATLVLGAKPGDVGADSAKVFEAVHAHDGIVMRSSTREGDAGEAGATFELLIPSAKLGDALAALSAIDEVRSRNEATADITAPTVNVTELLRDSKARIDSLLGQLEGAETESEREAVEAELRQERRHRARLRSQLQHLQRRADLSRVLVRIETGAKEDSGTGGGTWGVDDALGDAGQILAVAAAVTVVGLAILGPVALIALLAWLTHRAWVRRERRRVLS
ncbi:MAG TPA: DUF4349 domain-containing protein [Solirubrobacterales bacterium]